MRSSPTVGMHQKEIPGDKGNGGHRTGQRLSPTLGLAQKQTGHGYKLDMGTNWGLYRYRLGTGTNGGLHRYRSNGRQGTEKP